MPRVKTENLNWGSSKNDYKRMNDERIYTSILNFIRNRKVDPFYILTLPAADWIFETKLLSYFKEDSVRFFITGLEENTKLHEKFVKTALSIGKEFPEDVLSPMCESVGRYTSYWSYPKSCVYLDWMGTWGRKSREDIKLLFSKKSFDIRALLILTVMLNRGGKEADAPDMYRLYNEDKLAIPIEEIHNKYLSLLDAKRRKGKEGITDNFLRKVNGIPHSVREIAMENDYFVDNVDINIYPGKETDTEFGKNGRAVRKHNYEISFIFNIRKRFAALRGGPYGKESYKPLIK